MTDPLNIISDDSVYDYKDVGSSSVVYIFHKGISLVRTHITVAMKYRWICQFYIERKSTFNFY